VKSVNLISIPPYHQPKAQQKNEAGIPESRTHSGQDARMQMRDKNRLNHNLARLMVGVSRCGASSWPARQKVVEHREIAGVRCLKNERSEYEIRNADLNDVHNIL
jgi:hypothetical protein